MQSGYPFFLKILFLYEITLDRNKWRKCDQILASKEVQPSF